MQDTTAPLDPAERAELAAQLDRMRASGQRLAGVRIGARKVWIKIATHKALRVQLLKGSPARLMAREARLLRAMAARGAPVPLLLASGVDHLVLADCGQALSQVLATRPGDASAILSATGAALARMHALGCTQGRPYIRDILVDAEGRVVFTDFERGGRIDAGTHFRNRDVVALLLSIYARFPQAQAEPWAGACLAAYLAASPAGTTESLARTARRWRWLAVLTAPARYRERHYKPNKGWKEYQALPLALDRLAALAR